MIRSCEISQRPTTRIINLMIPCNIGFHLLWRARQPYLSKEASLLPNRNHTTDCVGSKRHKMKGEGCVSLYLKELPTLVREWVTGSYLAKSIAKFIATLATWAVNSAQNCQSLVRRLGFRLVALAGNSPYHPILSGQDSPIQRGLMPPLPSLYHGDYQSI